MNIHAQLAVVLHPELCLACRMAHTPTGTGDRTLEGCRSSACGWDVADGSLYLRRDRMPFSFFSGNVSFQMMESRFGGSQVSARQTMQRLFELMPHMCAHCLLPSCKSACQAGAVFKRRTDGMMIREVFLCQNHGSCREACPYGGMPGEAGLPGPGCLYDMAFASRHQKPLLSLCPSRVFLSGMILYDRDAVPQAASSRFEDLVEAQRRVILDPRDPEVVRAALHSGIAPSLLETISRSSFYRLAVEWRIALPLHPEWRTLPMIWVIPPLDPLTETGGQILLKKDSLPVLYLAGQLAGGSIPLVHEALFRIYAARSYVRNPVLAAYPQLHRGAGSLLEEAGLTRDDAYAICRLLGMGRESLQEQQYL